MRVRLIALSLVTLLLGACATPPRERVILLPDAEGGVGRIALLGTGPETVLSQPYASAVSDGRGAPVTEQLDPAQVRSQYARELAGLPLPPITRQFYFQKDSTTLTAESQADADALLAEVARRPAVDVVLTGHSDRRGTEAHNQRLALTRAMLIRARLIALGVSGFRIRVESRGEHEPAIATPDESLEPRNRRVELQAR